MILNLSTAFIRNANDLLSVFCREDTDILHHIQIFYFDKILLVKRPATHPMFMTRLDNLVC